MNSPSLKKKILSSFFLIIFVMSFFIALFRIYVIKINIIERAQNEVKNNLRAARSVYQSEIEKMKLGFNLVSRLENIHELQEKLGLDYIKVVDKSEENKLTSEIVKSAFSGIPIGGTRIVESVELKSLGEDFYSRAKIEIRDTPQAKPSSLKTLDRAMAIEYALPLTDKARNITGVIYAGKIINNDFHLIDKIHDLVFENRLYDHKPIGTVTIFQDDVRVATNVLDDHGKRAIGTRVSGQVYERVLKQGKSWIDRAFVVTDWYLTAYEPIKNINGNIIGMLYVGILEKPFNVMTRNVLLGFLAIILFVVALAVVLAFILAAAITKPLTNMLDATAKISSGDLEYKVKTGASIKELNRLAESFNQMAAKLGERDKSLKISNDKLSALNKSYLDLIGFVAHELKGILSSTILNAYSVRDGFLGMINFKQRKALDSVARNLDYFASTIRNFLNLSRIEKQELFLNNQKINIKEDIFSVSIDAFAKEASEKNIQILNNIDKEMNVLGDLDLLQIVANNLVANAIKYGVKDGKVMISSKDTPGEIEVYNDGVPIKEEDKEKLFRKFSRLNYADTRKERGTGLGLFVTKEIIEKHGGKIWVVPQERGNSFIFRISNQRNKV